MLSICFSGSVPPIRLELRGRERSSVSHNDVTRRVFLGSLAALGAGARIFTQSGGQTPIVPRALNHMTLSVTDIGRSLEFYQGLFGMPLAARQANTLVLRIGEGPQFLALSGGNANASRTMNHLCLTVDDFDADRLVGILGEHGVMPAEGRGLSGGPMRVRIRMRGEDFGGAAEGTPELYFGDPDGVVVQLQETRYCGGQGVFGEVCDTVDPAPAAGIFTLRELNHFTIFVSGQARSIGFYQTLFGMPINTYQGALPLLSVGDGAQFLALAQVPAPPTIHHPPCVHDDRRLPARRGHGEASGVRHHAKGSRRAWPRAPAPVVCDDAYGRPRWGPRRHPRALLHRSRRHSDPAAGRDLLRRVRLSWQPLRLIDPDQTPPFVEPSRVCAVTKLPLPSFVNDGHRQM